MKIVITLCLLFTLACQPQEPSVSLTEQDITSVREASMEYGSSIVSGDFDKIRNLMDADIVLMPSQDAAASGVEAAVAYMKDGPSVEGSITPKLVDGSGNHAFVRGVYDLTFSINDTLQIPDKGKYIEIWEKQEDGSWKVAVDIWNSDLQAEM